MASVASFSPAAILLRAASPQSIHKLPAAKSRFSCKSASLITASDEEFPLLARTLRLKPCDLGTLLFMQRNEALVDAVARAYTGGDSGSTVNTEDAEDGDGGEESHLDGYDLPPNSENYSDSVEIEIEKLGKNCRRIRSKVAVRASLLTVWNILTDYERLADFIPGLAVCQLLEKRDKFARLFQVGEQNLAFGLKFNAKGTLDCFEKDLETFPFGQKRDIEFKMVEGDFQLFEGKWSVEQGVKSNAGDFPSDSFLGQEFQTTLGYVVDVIPKLWLPVHLIEGRLCQEIRKNLSCIRGEAEKAFQSSHSQVIAD